MHSLLALLAPLALGSPALPAEPSAVPAQLAPEAPEIAGPGGATEPAAPVWASLAESWRPETQAQVRIERRVIVRIAPRMPPHQEADGDDRHEHRRELRFQERKMGRCLPIRGISGVQIGQDDRLLLFMRDRGLVAARLEKSCHARDFYSGFYVESSPDGLICAERDLLQSRSGASCEITRLRRLVPDED